MLDTELEVARHRRRVRGAALYRTGYLAGWQAAVSAMWEAMRSYRVSREDARDAAERHAAGPLAAWAAAMSDPTTAADPLAPAPVLPEPAGPSRGVWR